MVNTLIFTLILIHPEFTHLIAPCINNAASYIESIPPSLRARRDQARPLYSGPDKDIALEAANATVESFNKAKSTIDGYNATIKRIQTFIRDNCHDASLYPYTPNTHEHIYWYLAEQRRKGLKGTTLEQATSALKHFYRAHAEKITPPSSISDWPVNHPAITKFVDSCKTEDNRTGVTIRAIPLYLPDMTQMVAYLTSDESTAAQLFTKAERLWFLAFSTTAWTLWTRCDELIKLRGRDIQEVKWEDGRPCMRITLTFRKTNQANVQKSNTYIIPPLQPCQPYEHLKNWMDYMSRPVKDGGHGTPIGPNSHVFPRITPSTHATDGKVILKGGITFSTVNATTGSVVENQMDSTAVSKLLENISVQSGVARENGRYTTHAFRRGGAQYRFDFSKSNGNPLRWTLGQVKWWGGWAHGESRDTIQKYLLEELETMEHYHGDILMNTTNLPGR